VILGGSRFARHRSFHYLIFMFKLIFDENLVADCVVMNWVVTLKGIEWKMNGEK
jgi:hypothetical protein